MRYTADLAGYGPPAHLSVQLEEDFGLLESTELNYKRDEFVGKDK